MGEVWRQGKNRLRWVVLLPLLGMDLALDELTRARENGACGVFMRGLEADRHLCDSYFFPLYKAAENLDLAVCIHSGSGSFAMHDYYGGETSFPRFKLLNVTAFHTLLFNAIPDMFPKLRFGFIESGAQWLPYAIRDLLRRIERQRGNPKGTAKKNFSRREPVLRHLPDRRRPRIYSYLLRRGQPRHRHRLRPLRRLRRDRRAEKAARASRRERVGRR
jgi:predicted TIM-barrel fold metal-dependent hydrolase